MFFFKLSGDTVSIAEGFLFLLGNTVPLLLSIDERANWGT